METLQKSLREERTKGIIVPRRRWRALMTLVVLLAGTGLFLFLCLLFARSALETQSAMDHLQAPVAQLSDNQAPDYAPVIVVGLFGLVFASMAFWVGLSSLRFVLARRPALVIQREGIWVARAFDPFLNGGDMLAWDEIQRIGLAHRGREIFCVYLKNSLDYSQRHYGRWKRFVLRREIAYHEPILISQAYLNQPLDEVVEQMADLYAQEIDLYGVQLDEL